MFKFSTEHTTCPSLSVTGISFCCSLFLTLPQLCCSGAVLATHRLQPLQGSLIHSPVTAITQILSHGSSAGSSGCSRAPQTPPFGSALAHGGYAVAGTGHPSPLPLSPCSPLATKPGNLCQHTWIKNTCRLQAGCWAVPMAGSGVLSVGDGQSLGSWFSAAPSRRRWLPRGLQPLVYLLLVLSGAA